MKILIMLLAFISALTVLPDINRTKKKLKFITIYPSVNNSKVNDTLVLYKHKGNIIIQKYSDTINYPIHKLYLSK